MPLILKSWGALYQQILHFTYKSCGALYEQILSLLTYKSCGALHLGTVDEHANIRVYKSYGALHLSDGAEHQNTCRSRTHTVIFLDAAHRIIRGLNHVNSKSIPSLNAFIFFRN
jgi:hypothetical protein